VSDTGHLWVLFIRAAVLVMLGLNLYYRSHAPEWLPGLV